MKIAYTVKELSELLGISEDSVYRLVRGNNIPHVKVGRRILFHYDLIDKWLRGESENSNK